MHFISLVASERRSGNSDLLGRLATRFALRSHADSGEVAYLKDFNLKQCRGCLNCVFENKKCKLDDDLYKLLDIIQEADRLLLIAPVYVLSIPGKLKMLLDRLLTIRGYMKNEAVKPALSIGVAALPDWHQFQLPIMNLLLLALSRHIVNSYIVYGAGPGEVLLGDCVTQLEQSVQKLIDYQDRPFQSQVSRYCPVDFSTLFERVRDDTYRCPVCLTPAKAVHDGYYFDAEDLNRHRWTRQGVEDHFIHWILQTRPRFKTVLKAIVKKKKELHL